MVQRDQDVSSMPSAEVGQSDSRASSGTAASASRRRTRAAWIVLRSSLPNVITLLSLGVAVSSLQALIWGDTDLAVRLILACVLLDGMDGSLARHLRLSSPMGRELDSLADVVAFGVAPAALLVAGPLESNVQLAALVGAIFAAAGAFRLARYNIEESTGGFSGLPITAAGGALAAIIAAPLGLPEIVYALVAVSLAALMVSRVSFKSASSARSRPRYLIVAGPAGLLGCAFLPGSWLAILFGAVFGAYVAEGVVSAVWRHRPAPLRDRFGTS